MPREAACRCPLCVIESHLLATLGDASAPPGLIVSGQLFLFNSFRDLLRILRTPSAKAASDQLLRGLFRLGAIEPASVESLVILAFIPMLHGTIRRVARHQPELAEEDITQQALASLLEVLRSEQIRKRESHLAFAIARAVKREVFEWAAREGAKEALLVRDADLLPRIVEDPFERHAQLEHFLERCAARGDLTASELDLLLRLKLEGSNGTAAARGPLSNAGRQRLKRVMAKLRRLAG